MADTITRGKQSVSTVLQRLVQYFFFFSCKADVSETFTWDCSKDRR
jgi:hypothetical protein